MSQLPAYNVFKDLPDEHHKSIWGDQAYYRVSSLVNGGSRPETDLFEGLSETAVDSEAYELAAAD